MDVNEVLIEEVNILHDETESSSSKRILCDKCFVRYKRTIDSNYKFYMCYSCELYLCQTCLPGHEQHDHIEVNDISQRDTIRRKLLNDLRSEPQREREFRKENISVSDRVEVKCQNDENDCIVYGFSGFKNRYWVLCDIGNSCVKIFEMGTNILHRYIRFNSEPWDVTEVTKESEQKAQNSSDKSEPEKLCLLAVTLPKLQQICFMDLNDSTARITKSINLDKRCYFLDTDDNSLFGVCMQDEPPADINWSVFVLSNKGDKRDEMQTDIAVLSFIEDGEKKYHVPKPAIHKGRIYLSEYWRHTIHCLGEDGVLNSITVQGCWPSGLSVSSLNIVYFCSCLKNEIFKLDHRLNGYSQLSTNTIRVDRPDSLYCYRERLFVSHWCKTELKNFVTVIRLL